MLSLIAVEEMRPVLGRVVTVQDGPARFRAERERLERLWKIYEEIQAQIIATLDSTSADPQKVVDPRALWRIVYAAKLAGVADRLARVAIQGAGVLARTAPGDDVRLPDVIAMSGTTALRTVLSDRK